MIARLAFAAARLRRRLAGEQSGMTLMEMVVALSILLLVLGIFMSVMTSIQMAVARQGDRSQSNDQVRLAVEQIDREVRSGNVLYDPSQLPQPSSQATGFLANQWLLVYTQANGPNLCVEWVIDPNQQLVTRSWPPTAGTDATTSWYVVADHIVNRTASILAFQLAPTNGPYGGRLVQIQMVANQNALSGSNVQVNDSVEARNTQYGYPSNVCNLANAPALPPWPTS